MDMQRFRYYNALFEWEGATLFYSITALSTFFFGYEEASVAGFLLICFLYTLYNLAGVIRGT